MSFKHIIIIIFIYLSITLYHQAATSTKNHQLRSINRFNNHNIMTDDTNDENRSPVVFVPGDGGSRLEAKLNKISRVHYLCDLKTEWFDIWLEIHALVPLVMDCFVDNMKLVYNISNHQSHNTPGVEIKPKSFGSIDSVDYLTEERLPKTGYFASIIEELVESNVYQRDIDMFAAPYDFRKAPNELEEFFVNLTKLIETTYEQNEQSKVTLICHSMGCPNSVYLLNGKSKQWRDKYIQRMISIAAPWAGSFKAIQAMLFGDKLGVIFLNGKIVGKLQSTFPSLVYLFPREPVYSRNRILMEAIDKNYTLNNLEEFFDDINKTSAKYMWQDTRAIANKLQPPQVELWCLYGSGVKTPSKLIFDKTISDDKHNVIYGDGDGTVNLESLSYCLKWKNQQKEPIYSRVFQGLTHVGMLRGKEVAKFISSTILGTSTAASGGDYIVLNG